jgi:serine/threonine protein kinase
VDAKGSIELGDRIGDYRVEAVFGRGTQLDVCFASHVVLPRRALIRVASRRQATAAGIQLLREACILEALNHPGVPRLYDCGRLGDRRPWVATERVSGRQLGNYRPMSPAAVAQLIRDTAAILEVAHARGVVNRGVRPDALLLAPSGRGWPVCLTDWSDARALDSIREPRPAGQYDAPEIASDLRYDGRLDVFSLGIVVFEALSNTSLVRGDARRTMVADQLLLHAGHRGTITPAVSELAWLIDDMMSPVPANRPTAMAARTMATSIVHELERELAESVELAAEAAEPDLIDVPAPGTSRRAPTDPSPLARLSVRKLKWTPGYDTAGVRDDTDAVPDEITPDRERS